MLNSIKMIGLKILSYLRGILDSLSIQTKIILSIVFGISIFVSLCAFLIVNDIQVNIDRQVIRLNQNLKTTQMLAAIGSQALVQGYKSNDVRQSHLAEITEKFMKDHPGISYVVFTDIAGNILHKSHFSDKFNITEKKSNKLIPPQHVPYIKLISSESGKLLTIAEPLQFNSNLLGWVWVGMPDIGFTIVGSKRELLFFIFEIFMLVWVLSIIGAVVNSLIIIRPLRKLEKSAKAITEGRFGFQLPLKGFLGKELTQLVKAFNKMSKRLQQYEESNLAILGSERNKFESVVMSIADGVIVCDKEDTIQIINPQAARLLDRSSDELIGQKITDIWNKDINEQIIQCLNIERNKSDKPMTEYATFEFIRENKNLKLLITPLDDINKEQLGSVIVIQDRTKEAEIEMIKQEFISNVSHELRTPITSIKCYVDTLCSHKSELNTDTRNEFLNIINEETDRLSKLVNDVLELSRLESPARKLQLTLQEVYSSIDYALKSIKVLADKKSIRLIKDIEAELPTLLINQENLERVLINLLSNAIKYTPGNGMVKLAVRKDNQNILFQVIDNGIGIEEEHIPLLFERFYRIENKVHTIKGTGLGLTIVKKSVEQHGGNITIKSNYGEGSIFEFTIPIPGNESISPLDEDTAMAKSA